MDSRISPMNVNKKPWRKGVKKPMIPNIKKVQPRIFVQSVFMSMLKLLQPVVLISLVYPSLPGIKMKFFWQLLHINMTDKGSRKGII